MVFFNHATRQMTAKIVYYGPGLCGKTTNLNTIYGKTSTKARGEMVSLNTETDRTLFFDLLPMDVGMVGGFKTKLQLYTVPGQVFYNSTRKLVLKGVDGIVFVVDSQVPMLDASKESLQNLEENLKELGLKIGDIPMVFQWNKRDLKNIVPVEQLEKELNLKGQPSFQACAQDGTGVFETLRGITKLSLGHIKTHVLGETTAPAPTIAKEPPIKIMVPDPMLSVPQGPSSLTPAQALSTLDLSDSRVLDEDTDYKSGDVSSGPQAASPSGDLLSGPSEKEFDPSATQPVSAMRVAPLPDEETAERPMPAAAEFPETKDEATALDSAVGAPAQLASTAASVPSLQPKPLDPIRKQPTFSIPSPSRPAPTAGKSPNPKDAINSLLGELTLVGKFGAPSIIRVDLPSELDPSELEIVVTVKQKGLVVGEGSLKRAAPSKGIAAKLSIELKRP